MVMLSTSLINKHYQPMYVFLSNCKNILIRRKENETIAEYSCIKGTLDSNLSCTRCSMLQN